MRTILTLALTVALLAMPVAGAQAATAGQAARTAARCFRAEGWKATVNGRTVKATAPRLRPRNNFPRHPSIQIQFNKLGPGRFLTVQVVTALNDAETKIAKHCVNRGKHA